MEDAYLFFMPWRDRFKKTQQIQIKQYDFYENHPFCAIINENGTFKNFIENLKQSDDQAKGYLSKYLSSDIDLDEIKEIFHNEAFKVLFDSHSHKRGHSILVATGKDFFRIKLTNEPDDFGKWKICHIEKETSCL